VWRSLGHASHTKPSHISSWQLEPSMKALQSRAGIWRESMFCEENEYVKTGTSILVTIFRPGGGLKSEIQRFKPGASPLCLFRSRSSAKVTVNSKSEKLLPATCVAIPEPFELRWPGEIGFVPGSLSARGTSSFKLIKIPSGREHLSLALRVQSFLAP
jgi:hypothetical protein